MKSKSKNLLCAGVMAAFTLSAPHASAVVIAEYGFNTNGENEGWIGNTSAGTLTTTTGSITGTVSVNNDPQLLNNSVSLSLTGAQTWDTIIFRVRETDSDSGLFIGSGGIAPVFDTVGLNVSINGAELLIGSFTSAASGNDFFTVTADISALAPGTTITNLRVDPIGGASSNSSSQTNGNFFEVDFIQVNAVPEPSAALLGCFGLLALMRRRR